MTTTAQIEKAIDWFEYRAKGGAAPVTYSMAYRYGPGSYDCSSSVDAAFTEAGIWPQDGPDNTDSMHADFAKIGWRRVPANADGSITARRGDVFIWGKRGASTGAFGHTGIFVDPDNIIHCNYGYNGITVNNHDVVWSANGRPPVYIYRAPATAPAGKTSVATVVPVQSEKAKKTKDAPHWIVEAGDTLTKIATYYGIPGKVREIAKYNGLANENVISVGQDIYIPGPLTWIVEPGDTWEKINGYYGYSQGAVQSRNPGVALTPGVELKVWG